MYSDLRNKTIFDFTDDTKIIEEILLGDSREKYLSDLTLDGRYIDFLELADITKNLKLEEAAVEQLAPFCMGYEGNGGCE